jgi:predicted transcriptional regulator
VIAGQDLPVAADVGLNSLEQSVFDRLRQVNIPMGISELANSVKLDRPVVVSAIKKLQKIRYVERSGVARGTKYSVMPALRNHITPRILD